MVAWDFEVDMADLSRTQLRAAPPPASVELAPGEVLLGVERFSLTANNITYGVIGVQLSYWRFFPTSDGWGRLPVWGFAQVVRSRAERVPEGLRLYGYYPMSTHLVASLRPDAGGYVDEAPHRAGLAAVYNRYMEASETPHDDHIALLRPLFATSFLLDDYLGEVAPGATVLVSSASSKTALGLAWQLAQRGVQVVGLTSEQNLPFLKGLNFFEPAALYDDVSSLDVSGHVVFVNVAGNASVRSAVHERFNERLIHSAVVGGTHHQARDTNASGDLPGPKPQFFFAPDRFAKRSADWGPAELNARIREAMSRFIDTSSWLKIERHHGPDALALLYRTVLQGSASPAIGDVVYPR
ncbi:MAG: hypothetical protein AVDCRST_MAG23-2672 [uncultured Sphingosinicella sp.]|uniref:Bll1370 protein n=1 Tax=uncultured Sphingosinicella sp. TaxID=478748 RepID=A0A6J4UDC6_9SPHN|nr:DUF2855 family protein [uncultured Sphingosinicella sp.]CAA9547417.1 MAG: hypothetical protein AVDCRST_MAG23-2672 [uncultured Sphingosinicella sp.]